MMKSAGRGLCPEVRRHFPVHGRHRRSCSTALGHLKDVIDANSTCFSDDDAEPIHFANQLLAQRTLLLFPLMSLYFVADEMVRKLL